MCFFAIQFFLDFNYVNILRNKLWWKEIGCKTEKCFIKSSNESFVPGSCDVLVIKNYLPNPQGQLWYTGSSLSWAGPLQPFWRSSAEETSMWLSSRVDTRSPEYSKLPSAAKCLAVLGSPHELPQGNVRNRLHAAMSLSCHRELRRH